MLYGTLAYTGKCVRCKVVPFYDSSHKYTSYNCSSGNFNNKMFAICCNYENDNYYN